MFGTCIVVELREFAKKINIWQYYRLTFLTPGESVGIQTAVILTAPQLLFGLRGGNVVTVEPMYVCVGAYVYITSEPIVSLSTCVPGACVCESIGVHLDAVFIVFPDELIAPFEFPISFFQPLSGDAEVGHRVLL